MVTVLIVATLMVGVLGVSLSVLGMGRRYDPRTGRARRHPGSGARPGERPSDIPDSSGLTAMTRSDTRK
jgi:hypothetical protein